MEEQDKKSDGLFGHMKFPNYKDLTKSFFQFDMIRLCKLLHMAENAVITATFCFFAGYYINTFFEANGEEVVSEVALKGLLQMVVIILTVYYVRKLTKFIPFFLRLTPKYNPFHKSKDGEGLVGATIAMGLLLMSTQTNMRERIKKLIKIMDGGEKERNVLLHVNSVTDTNEDMGGN